MMMTNREQDLISIIVPIYNKQETLERCVDSILSQDYPNFELLLVDDGSTDGSGKICDIYAKKDSRVRSFHKENGGQASARNVGLDHARGEYVGFVDSDDYIDKDMYSLLYSKAVETGSDIAVCGRYVESERGELIQTLFTSDAAYTMEPKEACRNLLLYRGQDSSAWDKIFHVPCFDGVRFPEENRYICEDVAIVYQLLHKARRIVHCGLPKYHYVQYAGSMSHSDFSERTYGLVKYHKQAAADITAWYPDLAEEGEFFYYRGLIHAAMNYIFTDRKLQVGEQIVREVIQYQKAILGNKYLLKRDKLKAVMIRWHLTWLTGIIYRKNRRY